MTRSRVRAAAERQDGIVALDQLPRLGLSPDDIRGEVHGGVLVEVFPKVFALGQTKLRPIAWLRAALLSCGPESFLSHKTAAAQWGLWTPNPRRLEITVPGARAVRRKPPLVVHRATYAPAAGEVTTRVGLRLSSVARILVELAPHESQENLDELITRAVRKRVLNSGALELALAAYPRRPGIDKLRQASRGYRARPERKSGLEEAFDGLLERAGLPEPERNVILHGYEVDCYWPELGLVVELDGRNYHSAVRDMERDREKDGHLLLHGIETLRITDLRFESQPLQIEAELLAHVARRARDKERTRR